MFGRAINLANCCRNVFAQFNATQILPSTSYVQTRNMRRYRQPPWWIRAKHGYVKENLTPANRSYLEDVTAEILKNKREENSPLKSSPCPREEWTPQSIRTGLIAKKIGYFPQYTKDGKRFICTLLQIQDNYVLKYTDPVTWRKYSYVGKKVSKNYYGRLTLGINPGRPSQFTTAYRQLFEDAGVPPTERISSFTITPDAKIQPGTRLYATHFQVGQYVDLFGLTQDRGFQGVMKRWGFAGGPGTHGTTKAHRRPGSIGMRERRYVIVGKKLPGHMGNVMRSLRAVQIVRINTKYQVLYVRGRGVMGKIGNFIYVKDAGIFLKRVKNPPFPTHFVEEETEPLPEEYFEKNVFQFNEPTIMYEEKEVKVSKGGVKVKKQAKVQKK